MSNLDKKIKPGDWLGILGGGQLGRMFCQAAQSIGYKVAVFDPAENGPAIDIANLHIHANYDDLISLKKFADLCKSITIEFENIPSNSLKYLSKYSFVSPGENAVSISQDRILEKNFLNLHNFKTVPYVIINSKEDVIRIDDKLFPGILKTSKFGYDGKGQVKIKNKLELINIYEKFINIPCIFEKEINLDYEISVILARDIDSNIQIFPIPINIHDNGILFASIVDEKNLNERIKKSAKDIAIAISNELNYYGVLCVEFFVSKNGDIIVNEIAPRPHNSGHYSIDSCISSQFEQQVRIMSGMPLGYNRLLYPTIMLNILGDIWYSGESNKLIEPDWFSIMSEPGVKLHLYDKKEIKKNRKMGHINISYSDFDYVYKKSKDIASILKLKKLL
ncbi:N5-carboxyaminoimidazole ribonucleotide synthase [Candidatus Kinetoplastibacterium sorsogonicusi]|uniref:N5-carboxyaminoimidazole ribonucleotide synthase n=1 Tax=Candidatus Kinetoplastidibacterium kentomonadis TaxID=1576550 RepID=A0A3Q8ERB1_9PROT|nr:5-(carboxyamino)imidazole ribonucleotide synthase [Candidatus Kinetoplastibacterium sorsogonicusi]AWD32270.1 N5-carboxyaminoimidazole ribonucleotide synthase [Candidatus Kinetoplastibacterium sorsogonicusi]